MNRLQMTLDSLFSRQQALANGTLEVFPIIFNDFFVKLMAFFLEKGITSRFRRRCGCDSRHFLADESLLGQQIPRSAVNDQRVVRAEQRVFTWNSVEASKVKLKNIYKPRGHRPSAVNARPSVFFISVCDQTQTSTRPTLNHAMCNVYTPNVVET